MKGEKKRINDKKPTYNTNIHNPVFIIILTFKKPTSPSSKKKRKKYSTTILYKKIQITKRV